MGGRRGKRYAKVRLTAIEGKEKEDRMLGS